MPDLDSPLPCLHAEVVVRQLDEQGRHVVKNPRKQTYLRMGEQEAFLLQQFDGQSTGRQLAAAFQCKFNEPLADDDLFDFIKMAESAGLVAKPGAASGPAEEEGFWQRTRKQIRKQHIMYFRVKVFDPDRILNWLEPRTRWLFGRPLAVAAAAGTLAALLLMWTHRQELFSQFFAMLGWRSLAAAWAITVVATICHEFGHGLACKRYGGEVREMGALWIFLTPCFYCNVSDAWLLPSRWQRLLISMAGTYVDLLIWIPSVFIWRLTMAGTTVNYVAWIIATTCGLRVAFNINPLMRLDGYYAASDLLAIPNLRRNARARWMEHVRWLLWGGPRPQPVPDGRALLIYGVCSWVFTVGLLSLLGFKITAYLSSLMGIGGVIAGVTLFVSVTKRYFKGALAGEFTKMLRTRRKRLLIYAFLGVGLLLIPIRDRVGGAFHVRPVVRWEVRAPVAGFLREIGADEGAPISSGGMLARLEIPELTSLIARKQAEIHESEANLRRLEAGPRPEAVAEQREKVKRAEVWRDLAKSDLRRAGQQLEQEISRLESQIAQSRLEADYQNMVFLQAKQLYDQGGLAGQQLMSQRKQSLSAASEVEQAEAAVRARLAEGVLDYEAELARREKGLADTRSDLLLLLAGSRPEDIAAEQAHLRRLNEEAKHLEVQRLKQVVPAPASGIETTPRMAEKIGQYFNEGDLICIVEDPRQLEAEISIAEQDARVLEPGQQVTLKPRALPFHRLDVRVDRIAPAAAGTTQDKKSTAAGTAAAAPPSTQNTVTVYCQLGNPDGNLRSGMTGYGRIYQRVRPLGAIIVDRALRLVRTEFWW